MIDIAALDDIPRQGARVVRTAQGCIAVFRTATDQVFAPDDRCPRKGGPLSEGIVHGTSVTCPPHASVFDLNTGQAPGADSGQLRRHAVRTEDGRVFLDASLLARPRAAWPRLPIPSLMRAQPGAHSPLPLGERGRG